MTLWTCPTCRHAAVTVETDGLGVTRVRCRGCGLVLEEVREAVTV